jgi:hypothetical protein
MKTNLVKILSWICTGDFSNYCRRDFDRLCNNIVLLFFVCIPSVPGLLQLRYSHVACSNYNSMYSTW